MPLAWRAQCYSTVPRLLHPSEDVIPEATTRPFRPGLSNARRTKSEAFAFSMNSVAWASALKRPRGRSSAWPLRPSSSTRPSDFRSDGIQRRAVPSPIHAAPEFVGIRKREEECFGMLMQPRFRRFSRAEKVHVVAEARDDVGVHRFCVGQ